MYVQTWFFHKGMNFSKHVIWRAPDALLSMIGNTSNVISILSGYVYQAQQTSVLNDEIVMVHVSQGIK